MLEAIRRYSHGAYIRCMSLQTEQQRTHEMGFISYSTEQSKVHDYCIFSALVILNFAFSYFFWNPHSLSMRFHFSFLHIFIISNQLKICSNFFMLQKLGNQKNENLLHTFNDITLMYYYYIMIKIFICD